MWLIILALVFAFVILARLEGDEVVGDGSEFLINDGAADAYVIVPKVVTLGFPNETTGTVESKRLDLVEHTIVKLATLINGGNLTVQIQLIAATWTRLEAIRASRLPKKFKFRVPIDTGWLEKIVPGIVTGCPLEDLDAEKITVINLAIEVSGPKESVAIVAP